MIEIFSDPISFLVALGLFASVAATLISFVLIIMDGEDD